MARQKNPFPAKSAALVSCSASPVAVSQMLTFSVRIPPLRQFPHFLECYTIKLNTMSPSKGEESPQLHQLTCHLDIFQVVDVFFAHLTEEICLITDEIGYA